MENAEFAIAGTILDGHQNRSGASDKALSLVPDRLSREFRMAPAIPKAAFSAIKTP